MQTADLQQSVPGHVQPHQDVFFRALHVLFDKLPPYDDAVELGG